MGPDLAVGDQIRVKDYPGRVLAVDAQEALVEYTDHRHRQGLIFVLEVENGRALRTRRNPYGYTQLPYHWMVTMCDHKVTWGAITTRGATPPQPDELLVQRLGYSLTPGGYLHPAGVEILVGTDYWQVLENGVETQCVPPPASWALFLLTTALKLPVRKRSRKNRA